MSSAEYAQADAAVHQALTDMEQQCAQELAQDHLGRLRRKVLTSLQAHWPGLTLFASSPPNPDGQQRCSNGRSGPERSGAKTTTAAPRSGARNAGHDVNPVADPGAAPH